MKITHLLIALSFFMIESFTFTDINTTKAMESYEPCEKVYDFVAEMPIFRKEDKSIDGFRHYIQNKIKYPENARLNRIEGTVYIQYIVDKKGNVRDCKLVRGVNEELNSAALAAFENTPLFEIPGKNNGEPVCVAITMAVNFKLK